MNRGEKEIPSGIEILMVENEYFHRASVFLDEENDGIGINSRDTKRCSVVLPSKRKKNPKLLPLVVEFVLTNPKIPNLYCSTNAIQMTSDLFLKEIVNPKQPAKLPFRNILLFGVAGSGKSSFINSVLTTLGKVVSSVAAVGGGSNHVTTDITRFKLSQMPGLEKVYVNFFDIWGLDQNTFQKGSNMLLEILNGNLPEGYQMKERTMNTAELEESQWNANERRIHCILTFMPISILDSIAIAESLKSNLQLCVSKYKINPILIVTRASQAGDEVDLVKKKISDFFSIPEGSIYMMDNYTKEKEKSMRVDKMVIDIVYRAIENANQFVMTWA